MSKGKSPDTWGMGLVHPVCLLVGTMSLWVLLYLVSGIRYTLDRSPQAFYVLACGFLAFSLAVLLTSGFPKRVSAFKLVPFPTSNVERAIVILSLGALASVVLRILMGQPWIPTGGSAALAESRFEVVDDGLSIRTLGTPLSTLGVAAGIILSLVGRSEVSRSVRLLAYLALGQYLLFGLATGSRTHLAFVGVSLLVASVSRSTHRAGTGVFIKRAVLASAAVIAMLALSIAILSGRIEAQGSSRSRAVVYLRSAHGVDLPDALETLAFNNSRLSDLAYGVISISHYLLHGVFEFAHLYVWRDAVQPPLGMGTSTIGSLAYPVLGVFGLPAPEQGELLPYPGVYRTLWGSMLVDFGPIGLVVASAFFGFLAGKAYNALLRRRTLKAGIIYSVVAAMVAAAPLFNSIAGAYGIYCLIAAVFGAVLLGKDSDATEAVAATRLARASDGG